jgi:chromosome segregation ATPase
VGGSALVADGSAALSRAQQQVEARDRRILQVEQQLANVKAENEELRKRLAATERELARYAFIEEYIVKAGKRVMP